MQHVAPVEEFPAICPAAYAFFLCSDSASGITGSAQLMDAGWTAR